MHAIKLQEMQEMQEAPAHTTSDIFPRYPIMAMPTFNVFWTEVRLVLVIALVSVSGRQHHQARSKGALQRTFKDLTPIMYNIRAKTEILRCDEFSSQSIFLVWWSMHASLFLRVVRTVGR